MKIIKEYVTGAKVYRFEGADFYDPNYVGFDDCKSCQGQGYQEVKKSGNYTKAMFIQCSECALRHGSTEFYNPQILYKELAKQVKENIKCNARGKLGKRFKEIEDFNINHPLAKQYRKLLRDVWGWIEPEVV